MAKKKTLAGLDLAANFLSRSISEDPENVLSQYMLGRVYLYKKENEPAARNLDRARILYERQGWIPPDERMALARARRLS